MAEKKLNRVYISLGSNLGNREKTIYKSIEMLNLRIGKVVKQARLIETEPIGMSNTNLFINTCVEVHTTLAVDDLLNELKKIELSLGRPSHSKGKYQSRTIDLDIIFYNECVFSTENLTIPHPRYHERYFVLIPLLELNNHLTDPRTKLTIKQLIN